jgi:hypothetical protein
MNIPTPSMLYITPPVFFSGEPRRCVYEQVRVYVESSELGSVAWPAQYLRQENLYMTDEECGQLLGGN